MNFVVQIQEQNIPYVSPKEDTLIYYINGKNITWLHKGFAFKEILKKRVP